MISKTIANTFYARRDRNDRLINSGCSNHMIGDKRKFIKIENNGVGSIRFGDDQTTQIVGIL